MGADKDWIGRIFALGGETDKIIASGKLADVFVGFPKKQTPLPDHFREVVLMRFD